MVLKHNIQCTPRVKFITLIHMDPGVNSTLKTKMMCVGQYKTKPPIYEKLIDR